MREVQVNASGSYQVLIGSGLLPQIGPMLRTLVPGSSVVIVTDDTVQALYEVTVRQSLESVGMQTATFVIPHGEQSKCAASYIKLLNFLAEHRLTRSDAIVALGGGVVGDLAGFAAATYLRGIAFAQVPTTLLAAVDSSVGGKTAIDLDTGKNLAGAFWQPCLVLCDYDTLNTLSADIFADGCAEVIKYGVLGDEALFAHLEAHGLDFDRETVITRCVEMKRDIVMEDEFDNGQRQLLNLGHTLGHAVEACSDYQLSHGKAVAIGMASVARAAAFGGICPEDCARRIEAILRQFTLPTRTDVPIGELAQVMMADKKRRSSSIRVVLPERIGVCRLEQIPVASLESFMKAGL